MRNLLFLIAAALGALLPSCTPANRVVENPLIETANTRTLDIVKVELSDTATVLHMNAYYRPKNWIVISSDSYLQIPARKVPPRSPDSGTAPSGRKQTGVRFYARRFVPLDTPARQCSSKFDIAIAYSYLCGSICDNL